MASCDGHTWGVCLLSQKQWVKHLLVECVYSNWPLGRWMRKQQKGRTTEPWIDVAQNSNLESALPESVYVVAFDRDMFSFATQPEESSSETQGHALSKKEKNKKRRREKDIASESSSRSSSSCTVSWIYVRFLFVYGLPAQSARMFMTTGNFCMPQEVTQIAQEWFQE